MKQGLTFKIRFNPQDIMSAIDIVKGAGLYMEGMSLASIVRLAASSAFEQLRQNGSVPRRDGFEYQDMVKPYLGGMFARKQIIAQRLTAREADSQAMDNAPVPAHSLQPLASPEEVRLIRRKAELLMKQGADHENWTEAEQAELDEINKKLEDIL